MTMGNSRARMALAFMCVVLAALRFDSLAWLIPVLGFVLALGGCYEWVSMLRAKGLSFSELMAYAATGLMFLIGLAPADIFPWLLALVLGGVVVGSFLAHLARQSYEGALLGVSATLFPALYLGFALACGIQVLQVDRIYFLFVLVCVWAMDSAAYYFGCAYGRHKMAPRVSPKKSWEGAAAAVVGALVTAVLVKLIFPLELPWRCVLGLGVIFGVIGQLGDLAESALKRDAGVKDSGAAFGGHGGVLDRIDSLLFCFIAFYIWLIVTDTIARAGVKALLMAG